MVGFKLDDNGDVVIEDGKIQTASDNDFITQTVRQVLLTNLGEWEYDEDEGIDVYCMLTKNPNYEQIEENILSGLQQVDESFEITDFSHTLTDRKLNISFSAANADDEVITVNL